MSQYFNVYLHSKKDEWLPIGSYSRSNVVYEYGEEFVPYGKGTPLTEASVNAIISDIDEELSNRKPMVKKMKERKQLIASFNNSVEDKLEALQDVDESIEEIEYITENLREARVFFCTLRNIIDEVKYSDNYDADKYVWAGVEWCPDYAEEN